MILKNSFRTSFKSGLFLIVSVMASCREKDTVYEITDLTKKQRFTHITHTRGGSVYKHVTIEGQIEGCSEIAYFYVPDWDSTYLTDKSKWPGNTLIVNDSISWNTSFEEGDGSKHDFFFIPGDAVKGKITIRIKSI